jgi:fumarate reductase (CoM/CoB) subunit B
MQKGKVTLFRYNPEMDTQPRYEIHEFPFEPGMSVLDVAFYVYENIDGMFSFSYCCRNSHCGLCGARINGNPGLMCREPATREMKLEPLENLPVIRDLMVERKEEERGKEGLRLFLDRVKKPIEEPERINLEDLDRFKVASRCVECYSCLSVCPTFKEGKHEFLGPTGMVQLARHAFDPRDELNRELIAYDEGLYNCTTCRKCTEVCPHDIAPEKNISLLRAKFVASGQTSRAVTELIELVRKSQKGILPPVGKRKTFLEENARAATGKVGFFVGCNFDYDFRLMPAAVSTVKILQQLGIELTVPPGQVCCGAPLVEVGAQRELKELVVKNVETFKETGCTELVTLCSGCSLSLKQVWPDVYKKATGCALPFRCMDLTELLVTLTPFKDLKPLKKRMTYHDPCLLKRGQGISLEPRQLLRSLPDVEFLEMPEADHCCGGGGGLRMTNLEMAKRVLKRKMSFIKELEIELIVTCCPTCIKQLKLGVSQQGLDNVKVLHLAEVMAQAMGLSSGERSAR